MIYKFYNKKNITLFSAFIIPVVIMVIVYYFMGIHPFGNKTLLVQDMDGQYISFFSYFSQTFFEKGSYFYTFSKTMGGDMVGLKSYYLSSPLNIIFILFKPCDFSYAILFLTLIKIGLSGFTMNLYLNRENFKKDSVIFSSAYALMSYNIAYAENIMWLDGVILLPLIIFGIEKMIQEKSSLYYILLLAAAIIINYYTGFMLCIFSVIYFICYLLFFKKSRHPAYFLDFIKDKKNIRIIIHFFASSMLAGGIAAFNLIPLFNSLQGGKADLSISSLYFRRNFDIIDLLSKLIIGSYSKNEMMRGLPNIYCGMFIVLFAILFFVSKKSSIKEKLGYGLLVVSILISFYVNTFNMIWHGLNLPTWFPYRYSFILSFLMIVIGYKGYNEFKNRELNMNLSALLKRDGRLSIFILLSFFIISMLIKKIDYEFLDSKKIFLSFILLLISLIVFYLYLNKIPLIYPFFGFKKINLKKALFVAAVCVCLFDLGFNAYQTLNWKKYSNYDTFTNFININKPIIDKIKKDDSQFYRIEKTYNYNLNDPMTLNYNGLTHFSSSEKEFTKRFMGKMGFRDKDSWTYYNQGSTISADSLLGVKYVLSKTPSINPYNLLRKQEDVFIYENQYALPLGFMVHEKVLDASINDENLFEVQNTIWESMIHNPQGKLFYPAEIKSINMINVAEEETEDGLRYKKEDKNKQGFIEFYIYVNSSDPLYAYFPTYDMKKVEIFLNEESLGFYYDIYRYDIIHLGTHEPGETIVFKMKLKKDDVFINKSLFYHQDMNVFTKYVDELKENPFIIKNHNNSFLDGEITNSGDKKFALFTIPYDENWHIKIDGKPVSAVKIFDTLTAVEIPEGNHSITLKYQPKNMISGIVITVISLASVIALAILSEKARMKKIHEKK